MLLVALVPRAYAAWTAVYFVPIAVLARAADLPLVAFKRMLWIQPFLLGAGLLALVQGEGFTAALSLAVKSTVSLATLQLLTLTTPFQELLGALRRIRLPKVLLLTLALLHRTSFLVLDEIQRLRRARKARTWSQSKRATWRSSSSVIAASFVRSTARAERISRAMQARGGP